MKFSVISSVRNLMDEYRRFLKTSYRFLDEDLRKQFEDHLSKADIIIRGPYVTLARDYQPGVTLESLVKAEKAEPDLLKVNWAFGQHPIYIHQEMALSAGRDGRPFVVTTGTGSGKSEAFFLPVLDGIIRRKKQGIKGVQAILMYPMNALANDQLERLRTMMNGSGLDVSFALYTGDSESAAKNLKGGPVENERVSRDQIRDNPPDIILTNYKQLEFLLVRREDRALFTKSLKYLVLDELHSYRGAHATEIACLIRRLKTHAGLKQGELVGIATSATVGSGEGGNKALAEFASTLYGETFKAEDIIGEILVPMLCEDGATTPPVPILTDEMLFNVDPQDEGSVVPLAESLTGRKVPATGTLTQKMAAVLSKNAFVETLENIFLKPISVGEAAILVKEKLQERAAVPVEDIQREIEAYLLIGSVYGDADTPRLRPKLHLFFHGIYDVSICLNPSCRALVPHGASECPKCHSAARPAALCRTCGQDFVKVKFHSKDDEQPVGSGDFFSSELTAFLTPEIHALPDSDEDEDVEEAVVAEEKKPSKKKKKNEPEDITLCVQCGRILSGGPCPACNTPGVPYKIFRGKLNTCPACGDRYTRMDIVSPLRTGTASTVSTIITHHMDLLPKEDRKILVFADNRQDVAHQAGYTEDKNRNIALRHLIAQEVKNAGSRGVFLNELPQKLYDHYRYLGFIHGRPSRPEQDTWVKVIEFDVANELSRYTRQRTSLENLGLVAVDYEYLDELAKESAFAQLAQDAGIDASMASTLVRSILDVMRKERALHYDFNHEYLDTTKGRYRDWEMTYGVRFPDKTRSPIVFALDRPDHIRKAFSSKVKGFFQEGMGGQPPAIQKLVLKVIKDKAKAIVFIKGLVPLLQNPNYEFLLRAPDSIVGKKNMVSRLSLLQVSPRRVRLTYQESGYRCNACKTWRAYDFPACPTPKCNAGSLHPSGLDEENYYVRLYTEREPQRFAVAEHSAQIKGEERMKRETDFKEGRLNALVCTPTLELGVDIGPLLTVALRNAPPMPANYVQRVGRAGRRLRIGFVSTFCAGSAHDRHAFENPSWLISGNFSPARIRLENPKIVERHLRSFILESIEEELPKLMGDLLDDKVSPTRMEKEKLDDLLTEVTTKAEVLADRLASIFEADRRVGKIAHYGKDESKQVVTAFRKDLDESLEKWWQRVQQINYEYGQFAKVGSPRHDDKKAAARKRAFTEITQDRDKAYTLNYLAGQGFLPSYQFPTDTFSLDPGVVDTPTLQRPASIAIEEFAPGNYVYANGHKLKSIRVLFSGGPGRRGDGPARSDAESTGRLRQFRFCEHCDEVTEEVRNSCSHCGKDLGRSVECVFVNAFEAEESLRIGSDEESRQRQYHVRKESLLSTGNKDCDLYNYPFTPIEYRRQATILITNWGKPENKTSEGMRFWICPECGRHLSYDPNDKAKKKDIEKWNQYHSKFCNGTVSQLVLAYEFSTDCLVLALPNYDDFEKKGFHKQSGTMVTLAQALLAGATNLLEIEAHEIAAFPRLSPEGNSTHEIVFYETVPGGAGYLEQMARRLPEVAQEAHKHLFNHVCSKACYVCLKNYRNQNWHAFFNKDLVRDHLREISQMDPVGPEKVEVGEAVKKALAQLDVRRGEVRAARRAPGTKGPESPIETLLYEALKRIPGLPLPEPQFEILNPRTGALVTVPDFAYPKERIAVFCDGFAYHGNVDTLELDAKKRNWLQSKEGGEWSVMTFWGRSLMKNADVCAREVESRYRERTDG